MPEGLAVFTLSETHRRKIRTANPVERAICQEIKPRAQKIRVFPNRESLERLIAAILVEFDEQWSPARKAHLERENQIEHRNQKSIHQVA